MSSGGTALPTNPRRRPASEYALRARGMRSPRPPPPARGRRPGLPRTAGKSGTRPATSGPGSPQRTRAGGGYRSHTQPLPRTPDTQGPAEASVDLPGGCFEVACKRQASPQGAGGTIRLPAHARIVIGPLDHQRRPPPAGHLHHFSPREAVPPGEPAQLGPCLGERDLATAQRPPPWNWTVGLDILYSPRHGPSTPTTPRRPLHRALTERGLVTARRLRMPSMAVPRLSIFASLPRHVWHRRGTRGGERRPRAGRARPCRR